MKAESRNTLSRLYTIVIFSKTVSREYKVQSISISPKCPKVHNYALMVQHIEVHTFTLKIWVINH